jgi:hypothetical protein
MVDYVGTGVYLEVRQLEQMRILMAADRRSLAFLVRDAVDLYLESRKSEISELKRQKKKKVKENE